VPEYDVITLESTETKVDAAWRVLLFDDDVHTFDEVIAQLVRATSCSRPKAEAFAWQVHTRGEAIVFDGQFEPCFRVQQILRQIELITEVRG